MKPRIYCITFFVLAFILNASADEVNSKLKLELNKKINNLTSLISIGIGKPEATKNSIKYNIVENDGRKNLIAFFWYSQGSADSDWGYLALFSVLEGVPNRLALLTFRGVGIFSSYEYTKDGEIKISSAEYSKDDAHCCASFRRETVFQVKNGEFLEKTSVVVPAKQ